jgi:hypothetical protein
MKRKFKYKKLSLDQARRVAKITPFPVEVILKWTSTDVFNLIPMMIGKDYQFVFDKHRDYKLIDTKNPSHKPTTEDWYMCEDYSIKSVRTRKRVYAWFTYSGVEFVPSSRNPELYELKYTSPALSYYTANFTEGCINFLEKLYEIENNLESDAQVI